MLLGDDGAELFSVDLRTGMLVDRSGKPFQTADLSAAMAAVQQQGSEQQTAVAQGESVFAEMRCVI
jgi:hypothetical protein